METNTNTSNTLNKLISKSADFVKNQRGLYVAFMFVTIVFSISAATIFAIKDETLGLYLTIFTGFAILIAVLVIISRITVNNPGNFDGPNDFRLSKGNADSIREIRTALKASRATKKKLPKGSLQLITDESFRLINTDFNEKDKILYLDKILTKEIFELSIDELNEIKIRLLNDKELFDNFYILMLLKTKLNSAESQKILSDINALLLFAYNDSDYIVKQNNNIISYSSIRKSKLIRIANFIKEIEIEKSDETIFDEIIPDIKDIIKKENLSKSGNSLKIMNNEILLN